MKKTVKNLEQKTPVGPYTSASKLWNQVIIQFLFLYIREHIQLLDSVEQYGFGNWGDVAKQLNQTRVAGPVRAPEEAQDEFCRVFIRGPIGRIRIAEILCPTLTFLFIGLLFS